MLQILGQWALTSVPQQEDYHPLLQSPPLPERGCYLDVTDLADLNYN